MSKIKIGDFVNVYFNGIEHEFSVQVLYTPFATGDVWSVKRQDGTIVDIQSFCKMVKLRSVDDDSDSYTDSYRR